MPKVATSSPSRRRVARKTAPKWVHMDAKVSVIQRADIRIEAFERPDHQGSRLQVGEGCMSTSGTMMYVLEDYGLHRVTVDGVARDEVGYVVWHPEHGRVFAKAGYLWAMDGSVRHLRLV